MPRHYFSDAESDDLDFIANPPPNELALICAFLEEQAAREQELARDELDTLIGLINRDIDASGVAPIPASDTVLPVGQIAGGIVVSGSVRSDGSDDGNYVSEAQALANEVQGHNPSQDGSEDRASSPSVDEDQDSVENVLRRLHNGPSAGHTRDFDLLLDSSYHYQTQTIRDAAFVLASARTQDDEPVIGIDDVDPDAVIEGASTASMTTNVPPSATPAQRRNTRIVLPHLYLPGWQGSGNASNVDQWDLAIRLASGRYNMRMLPFRSGRPTLPESYVNLGFPNARTFSFFIYRPDVRAAFKELWDDFLETMDPDEEICDDNASRRQVSARIFFSRCIPGRSAYETVYPDKSEWNQAAHLTRFALKIEKVCDKWLLPPLRGQIPILAEKLSAVTVAWGGIELARVLRRLQKGYGSYEGAGRYLD